MASLAEQIEARKNAAIAAAAAEAARNAGAQPTETDSSIASGMEGSVSASHPNTPPAGAVPDDKEFFALLAEAYKDEPDAYVLKGVRQLILAGGRMVKPDAANVVVPKDDVCKKMLEWMDAQNTGLVYKLKQE